MGIISIFKAILIIVVSQRKERKAKAINILVEMLSATISIRNGMSIRTKDCGGVQRKRQEVS